jgi:uncharacterized membrane protein
MNITITTENIYMFVSIFLLIMQVYQQYKLDKAKKEIKQLWDQISTWNTIVALKLLETQKELTNLKENKKD